MVGVSATFPKTRRNSLGYNIEQVEDFLEDARRAYTAERGAVAVISAVQIRQTAFDMVRGGYSPEHVDAALERLEDAFALRERERRLTDVGEDAVVREKREVAQEIVDRLARPAGERFSRVNLLAKGYRRNEVDALCDRVADYLTMGTPLDVADVRSAAFHPQRGGYREAQVDMLLDAVIDIIRSID